MSKQIPIGIEDFKRVIDDGCYFVDKTMMIKEILDDKSMVRLLTRPRRFGKTLNMSMIQYFFENTEEDNSYLFENLEISKYPECMKEQGKYPVINVSFKDMKRETFELAYDTYKKIIKKEFIRHEEYILNNANLDTESKERYEKIIQLQATFSDYSSALLFLTECMEKAYNQPVILLVDEYDVPLENAYTKGFYDKMIDMIRSIFSSGLKTNSSLQIAILTGCLRVSKESIFTGVNNFKTYSLLNNRYSTCFGFTEDEVTKMLADYGISKKRAELQKWYNGYIFGESNIYNPWSVLNYVDAAMCKDQILCAPYWSNTSSNSIVKDLIEKSDMNTRTIVQDLLNGIPIKSTIHEEITYDMINKKKEYLWSFLLLTGYLKATNVQRKDNKYYFDLFIPNVEVKTIYEDTVMMWFENNVQSSNRDEFFKAMINKDAEKVNEYLQHWLMETISYYDERESYYHGFLSGLLMGFEGYVVKSNRESGDGRYDLLVLDRMRQNVAIIFEFKISDTKKNLQQVADEAVKQIEEKNYAQELEEDEYDEIIKYGIAFCKKRCYTKLSEY